MAKAKNQKVLVQVTVEETYEDGTTALTIHAATNGLLFKSEVVHLEAPSLLNDLEEEADNGYGR